MRVVLILALTAIPTVTLATPRVETIERTGGIRALDFVYQFRFPRLEGGVRPAATEQVNDSIRDRCQRFLRAFRDRLDESDPGPKHISVEVRVGRLTKDLLSLAVTRKTSWRGSEEVHLAAWNYDLIHGVRLRASALFTSGRAVQAALHERVVAKLRLAYPNLQRDWVKEGVFLDQDAVVFICRPRSRDLLPARRVELDYEELRDLLSDLVLPPQPASVECPPSSNVGPVDEEQGGLIDLVPGRD